MSVAYVILAHHRPSQLGRLLRRLHHPDDRVFIHLDRQVPLEPFASALSPFLADGYARFSRRRFRAHWADYSLVAATLSTLEQALQDATFTHVSLLSGQDYPLQPASVLRAFFDGARDRSFMFYSSGDATDAPKRRGNETWYWNGDLRRVTYRHYRVFGRQLHLPNRYVPNFPRLAPPQDLALYQGSQWWTLSREAARYVVETMLRRPDLRRYFRRTQAPDEFVFQSLLCNSSFRPSVVNDDLHFIDWQGWHARSLTLDDLSALSTTSKLFARKLDENQNPRLLDELDRLAESRATTAESTLEQLKQRYQL